MERDIFDEWFEENIENWISKAVDRSAGWEGEIPGGDEVGLIGASDFFHFVASYLDDLDTMLEGRKHKISLAGAYDVLAFTIEWLSERGLIDEWDDVLDLFKQRVDEFAAGPEYEIKDIGEDISKFAAFLYDVLWSWKLNTEGFTRDGDFSDAEKIQTIRATLLLLRNKRYLDYNWPWFKELIASLDVDWRIMGGGFDPAIPPGYVPPWSHG